MFINVTQTKITLDYPIDNTNGNKLIAIREMFYRVNWFNNSEEKKNNWIKKFVNGKLNSVLTLHDGYYSICELKEQLRDNYGIDLSLSNANLKVTLAFNQESASFTFEKKLSAILGFENNAYIITAQNHIFESEKSVNLEVNSLICVCLDELSSTENSWNGKPSKILSVVPSSDNAPYCKREIKSFASPQFKKLTNRMISKLTFNITNIEGHKISCNDLYILLEVI